MSDHDNELTRRDVIKLGAAATAAVSLGVGHAEAQARVGGFLTESEFAILDELSEMITLPTLTRLARERRRSPLLSTVNSPKRGRKKIDRTGVAASVWSSNSRSN